ncbi:MAG: VanZ family protein [Clostridia bacterium]
MTRININKTLMWVYGGLAVLVMAAIFLFSCQPGESSQDLSKKVLDGMKANGTDIFTPEITVKPDTADEKSGDFVFNLAGRKWGHFYLYAALGVLVLLWWRRRLRGKEKGLKSLGAAAAFCFLYACADEFNQHFVPGRTGCFSDVLYDAAGFGAAILMTFCICELAILLKRRNSK